MFPVAAEVKVQVEIQAEQIHLLLESPLALAAGRLLVGEKEQLQLQNRLFLKDLLEKQLFLLKHFFPRWRISLHLILQTHDFY